MNLRNAPVTDAMARDMILEAHRLLKPTYPLTKQLVFVEFHEAVAMALDFENGVIYYHSCVICEMSLNDLCTLMTEPCKAYTKYVEKEHDIPKERVLH